MWKMEWRRLGSGWRFISPKTPCIRPTPLFGSLNNTKKYHKHPSSLNLQPRESWVLEFWNSITTCSSSFSRFRLALIEMPAMHWAGAVWHLPTDALPLIALVLLPLNAAAALLPLNAAWLAIYLVLLHPAEPTPAEGSLHLATDRGARGCDWQWQR